MNEKNVWYKLTPVDAWFFRDDRPYNGSEYQSGISTIFPPYAPTVVGAVRAALARENGWSGRGDWSDDLKTVLGDGFNDLGKLHFTGPFLCYREELLFTVPANLFGEMVEGSFTPRKWITPSSNQVFSDMGASANLPESTHNSRFKLSSGEDFFVTESGLLGILRGEFPSKESFHKKSQVISLESRIGLEREKATRLAVKGALYSPEYIRMHKHYSLVIGVRGLPSDWSLPSLFPLGGESRMTDCVRFNYTSLLDDSSVTEADMLHLVTPACFDRETWWGVDPGGSANALESRLRGEVSSICLDRYIKIGGWDSRINSPVESKPFIRPGAVWWLSERQEIPRVMSFGIRKEYGFGLILAGSQPRNMNCEDGEK